MASVCLPPGLQTSGDQRLKQERGSTNEIAGTRLFGRGEESGNNRAHLQQKRLGTAPACKVMAGAGCACDHGQMSVDWQGGERVPRICALNVLSSSFFKTQLKFTSSVKPSLSPPHFPNSSALSNPCGFKALCYILCLRHLASFKPWHVAFY